MCTLLRPGIRIVSGLELRTGWGNLHVVIGFVGMPHYQGGEQDGEDSGRVRFGGIIEDWLLTKEGVRNKMVDQAMRPRGGLGKVF